MEQDPEPHTPQGGLGATTDGGADVLQIEDSGDALDIDLDDPFQAQMLDISQPIVADEAMLKLLKQQVRHALYTCSAQAAEATCQAMPCVVCMLRYTSADIVHVATSTCQCICELHDIAPLACCQQHSNGMQAAAGLTLDVNFLQEVIIRPGKQGAQRCHYFKVMDPSTPICLAPCGHFYEEDEYEMHVLEHGSAPFCSFQSKAQQ